MDGVVTALDCVVVVSKVVVIVVLWCMNCLIMVVGGCLVCGNSYVGWDMCFIEL